MLAQGFTGAGALALGIAGCGAGDGRRPAASGSTRHTTWRDPVGDGQLRVAAGETMRARTELGAAAADLRTLTTLAHVTDAHVLDASSPARVSFLDLLGSPFQSTFRPQETLTAQVLAGMTNAVRTLGPDAVVQGGDLIDNDQHNELVHALAALTGGRVTPGSGSRGYYGVQLGADTNPFYYRPAVDAPRHPGLLAAAVTPFSSAGVDAAVLPVFGDHDGLVAGTVLPTPVTRRLAIGDRALWDLPRGLTLPAGLRARSADSPDGPPDPGALDELLRRALNGPTVRVPADPARRQLTFAESLSGLRQHAGPQAAVRSEERLDYTVDIGDSVRLIVLDIVRRRGGSGGEVGPTQPSWLARQLGSAGDRWVVVITHQPLLSSAGGDRLLALMDRAPRVIAALNGHTHRNAISPRPTAAGGYWLITTASLIDYPQQARALSIRATPGGGVAIHSWMLDHAGDGTLGQIARQLSYLDAQGGRPQGFAGSATDRNVVLYRRPVT